MISLGIKSCGLLAAITLLAGCGGSESTPPVSDTARYAVTVSHNEGGAVSPSSLTVTEGQTATFTFTPEEGYEVSAASGCSGSLSGNDYTTGAINAACQVSVTFSEILVTAEIALSSDVASLQDIVVSTNYDDDTFTTNVSEGVLSLRISENRLNESFSYGLIITIEGLLEGGRSIQYASLVDVDRLYAFAESQELIDIQFDSFSTSFAAYAISYLETTEITSSAFVDFGRTFVPEVLANRARLFEVYFSGARNSLFPAETKIFGLLSSNALYREVFNDVLGSPNLYPQIINAANKRFFTSLQNHQAIGIPAGEYYEYNSYAAGARTKFYLNLTDSVITAAAGPVTDVSRPYTVVDGVINVERSDHTQMSSQLVNCIFPIAELTDNEDLLQAAEAQNIREVETTCHKYVNAIKPLHTFGSNYLTPVQNGSYTSPPPSRDAESPYLTMVEELSHVPAITFNWPGYPSFTTEEKTVTEHSLRLLQFTLSEAAITDTSFAITEGTQLAVPMTDPSREPDSLFAVSDLLEFSVATAQSGTFRSTLVGENDGDDFDYPEAERITGTWSLNDTDNELTLIRDDLPEFTFRLRKAYLEGSAFALVTDIATNGVYGYRLLSYGGAINSPMAASTLVGLTDQTEPKLLNIALSPRFDEDLTRFLSPEVAPYLFNADGSGSFSFGGFDCAVVLSPALTLEHLPKTCKPIKRTSPSFLWEYGYDGLVFEYFGPKGAVPDCSISLCQTALFRLIDLKDDGTAIVLHQRIAYQTETSGGVTTKVPLGISLKPILRRMRIIDDPTD